MEKSTFSQIIIPIIILILFVIGIYGVFRLRNSIAQPPTLEVAVEDNMKVSSETLAVTGTTSADELLINNNKVDIAEDDSFSYQVPLTVGENTITFKATSKDKTTEIERTVTRTAVAKPASPAPTSDLSDSGPKENAGIIGLTALILTGGYYLKTRAKKQVKSSYKLFTN